MSFVSGLLKVAAATAAATTIIVASPFFGAVGTITAAGSAVASAIGATAGIADEVMKKEK